MNTYLSQYEYRLALPASAEAIQMELDTGITNPNLHRRIESDIIQLPGEFSKRIYKLFINGVNSYRSIEYQDYDMDENFEEIP